MNEKERQLEMEEAYEHGLPPYLQKDLDDYKKALAEDPKSMDVCFLWGELYGSINAAEISDGAITPQHAQYLRDKYLF